MGHLGWNCEECRRQQLEQREAALRAEQQQRAWMQEMVRREEEQRRLAEESARQQVPQFLSGYMHHVNIAVIGNTGVGKSSFVNAIRGVRPNTPGAAAVGVKETTAFPTPFEFPNERGVFIWDIPGAGTMKFRRDDYIRSFGIRHFDITIIMTAGRFTETEVLIMEDLQSQRSSCIFLVRTKVDIDIKNNESDNCEPAAHTKQSIRADLRDNGQPKAYLISSRNMLEHDFPLLSRDLINAARSAGASK